MSLVNAVGFSFFEACFSLFCMILYGGESDIRRLS